MEKRTIIHMLDPMAHTSPFDINMAADAGFDVVVPYNNVKLEQVHGLVQDAIFSRGPTGVKRTAIFIGGRDIGLAMAMLDAAQKGHGTSLPSFGVRRSQWCFHYRRRLGGLRGEGTQDQA
jgi:Methylene-tetrahydromethanopterin dehydrogenase, N-terminal